MVARELGVSKNMTAREAAIVSAYTGVLIGNFDNLHEYAEEIMGRPVYTHEFANKNFFDCLKEKSRDDFLSILVAPPLKFSVKTLRGDRRWGSKKYAPCSRVRCSSLIEIG